MHLAQARDARAMDCQKRAAECIESGCPRRYPVRGMQLRSAFFFLLLTSYRLVMQHASRRLYHQASTPGQGCH